MRDGHPSLDLLSRRVRSRRGLCDGGGTRAVFREELSSRLRALLPRVCGGLCVLSLAREKIRRSAGAARRLLFRRGRSRRIPHVCSVLRSVRGDARRARRAASRDRAVALRRGALRRPSLCGARDEGGERAQLRAPSRAHPQHTAVRQAGHVLRDDGRGRGAGTFIFLYGARLFRARHPRGRADGCVARFKFAACRRHLVYMRGAHSGCGGRGGRTRRRNALF